MNRAGQVEDARRVRAFVEREAGQDFGWSRGERQVGKQFFSECYEVWFSPK